MASCCIILCFSKCTRSTPLLNAGHVVVAKLLREVEFDIRWLAQGKAGMDMYKEFEVDRDRGNFDKLPELHAVLSGMKV
jgi:hypothetical protein